MRRMGGPPPVDEFGLLGATIEGKYAVESVVAAGGFGVVYRGRHQVLGNALALKVLKVPADMRESVRRAFVQMFLNEARIVASLRHPAVVRAVDFGAVEYAEGLVAPWMALDWIDGVTLAQDLDARRAAAAPPRRPSRSSRRCSRRWPRPTRRASSTATSSPAT